MKKIVLLLAFILVFFIFIGIKEYQNSKKIPINVSYEKFVKFETKLKSLAEKNNFKFSSHGDYYDESCYKTIILDSDEKINMTFDFKNYDGSEEFEISFDSNERNTSIFSLLNYNLLDQVFTIIFDRSYKNELMEKSSELLNFKNDSSSKIIKLNNNITAQYFLRFCYESKGVKSENYYASLIIRKN